MINYNGFNSKVVTIVKAGEDSLLGKLVTLDTNGKLVKAGANTEFIGVCVSDNGIYASVQVEGYVECKADTTITSHGWNHLVSTADGTLHYTSGAGPMRRVMMIDKPNETVGFIL